MMRCIVLSGKHFLQNIMMQNEKEKSFKTTEQSESIRTRMCFYCFGSLLQHSGIETMIVRFKCCTCISVLVIQFQTFQSWLSGSTLVIGGKGKLMFSYRYHGILKQLLSVENAVKEYPIFLFLSFTLDSFPRILVFPTWDGSRGGDEETQGERRRGNGH